MFAVHRSFNRTKWPPPELIVSLAKLRTFANIQRGHGRHF
jgi:hypothetical protein